MSSNRNLCNISLVSKKYCNIAKLVRKLTLSTVGAIIAQLTLTLAKDALPAAVAALRAVPGQFRRELRHERYL